ncbi:MAG: hypothetical protein ACLFVB_07790 [Thermoplasmata archaeon]
MKNFYKLLEDILEFEGYDIISSERGKIVAALEDKKRSFIIAGETLHDDDIERLKEAENEKRLVIFEEVSDELLEDIDEEFEVWDREKLINKSGNMTLEKSILEGITEGEKGIKGPDEGFNFDIEHQSKEAILKPIMDFQDVSELGEKFVKGFKYRLELVPHYVFNYKIEKGDGDLTKGKLYLNAISGKVNYWKGSYESVKDIKRSHVKLEPNIPDEESSKRARRAIKERFSIKKREKWEDEGVTIVEKSEEVPSDEKIVLDKKGIVYVPMWAVEGTDGIIVVNAARGKIESEMN